jgi:hypothetical protein
MFVIEDAEFLGCVAALIFFDVSKEHSAFIFKG